MPEIVGYYGRILDDRLVASGNVDFFAGCEYLGDRRFVSRVSGHAFEVPTRCRIVDAHYEAADDASVIAVNDLARISESPSEYVIVGSGKTSTDTCIWLLARGVDAGSICWVRPREPWMIDRPAVNPDPVAMVRPGAAILEAAVASRSVDDMFLRLEDVGIMMRIDTSLNPTMAKVRCWPPGNSRRFARSRKSCGTGTSGESNAGAWGSTAIRSRSPRTRSLCTAPRVA